MDKNIQKTIMNKIAKEMKNMEKGKGKGKGCCKSSKVIMSLASLVMLIALALGVNALTATIVSPASSATITGGTLLNVSFGGGSGGGNTISCALFASSPSTANSSTSLIFNNTNATTNGLGDAVNRTFSSTYVLEDAGDYTFSASCYNSTGQADATTTTSVVVDRTVPSVPTSPQPTGRQTVRSQTIQYVVQGANTTSCRLTFIGSNPGSVTYTMTHSGNNCSQSFSALAPTTFRFTISASDGTNRTAETAESEFNIQLAGTSGAKKYIIATGGGASQASTTSQSRAFGQDALDRAIAKAPANAQQGLTKAKEAVTRQYKGFEAVKTWSGTGLGCAAGFAGLALGPLGLITIPAGCVGGHIIGAVI